MGMSNKVELPSLEELREILEYNPETGELTRIYKSGKRKVVTCNGNSGILIKINRQQYVAHRLIWKLHTGEDPGELEIDHINHNRLDNSWSNLRLATSHQNSQNKIAKGIRRSRDKWRVEIQVARKKINVGTFTCPLIARLAYEDASRELRGEFSPA